MVQDVKITYPQDTKYSYYQEVQSPFIVGISSTYTLSNESKDMISKVRPFGIILMQSNVKTYEQTKSLIKAIKKYGEGLGIDIKIAIDEEGGLVSRLGALPNYPKGFSGITDSSKSDFLTHARYLKNLGIDVNLAPVVDIGYPNSVMLGRTSGSNPKTVSEKIKTILPIYSGQAVQSTLKHFPGLGRTLTDSHESTPTVSITLSTWENNDALPYIEGIKLGVENIMTAHVIYPQVDKNIATYSSKWNIDILRNDLGFKGRLISDDLKMGALNLPSEKYTCKNNTFLESRNNKYAIRSYKAYISGVTNPLVILSENDTERMFSDWITIGKKCTEGV